MKLKRPVKHDSESIFLPSRSGLKLRPLENSGKEAVNDVAKARKTRLRTVFFLALPKWIQIASI